MAGEFSALEDSGKAFWDPQPLEALLRQEDPPTVTDVRSLAVDFWPSDESADDINIFVSTQRHVDRGCSS